MDPLPGKNPLHIPPPPTSKSSFGKFNRIAESSLELTVCKHIIKSDPLLKADRDRAVKEASFTLTGTRQLHLNAFYEVGWPIHILPTRPSICTPAELFNKFPSTSLYKEWNDQSYKNLHWARNEDRAIAFHWVGWDILLMHNLNHLGVNNKWVLSDPDEEDKYFYIETVINFARQIRWIL